MRRRVTALAAAAFLAAPVPALACGGLFCQGGGTLQTVVEQTGERILFAVDGETVTAYVQILYQGEPSAFSWIVPVPTEPTIAVGVDDVFTALRGPTAPTFNLQWAPPDDACTPRGVMVPGATGVATGAAESTLGRVEVVERSDVGPYDAAVLRATDAAALKSWLLENKYVLPPKLDPLLDPYIAGKYLFVAVKLTKDRVSGDIQPIAMTYRATKPGIPIRLTGVAATPDMGVYVWVLGRERAVPENFRHVHVNEARLDWLNGARNYADLVTDAVDEAGGQAFVTEFAGARPATWPLPIGGAGNPYDVAPLRAAAQVDAFVARLRTMPIFQDPRTRSPNERFYAFVRRYVPKPGAHAVVSDERYYADPGRYPVPAGGEAPATDFAGAIAEIEARFTRPFEEGRALLGRHAYLTRLYTTMSPEEMTQDPVFVFNRDLPPVSNVHTVTAARRCGGSRGWQNPAIEITLGNGQRILFDPAADLAAGTPTRQPAAARVEQLKAEGGASVIADNQATIGATLAAEGALATRADGAVLAVPRPPVGGFSCAGCGATNAPRPPLSQGLGELLGYALVVAGWWGWRRRRG